MLYLDFETYDYYIGAGLGSGWTFSRLNNNKFKIKCVAYCEDNDPVVVTEDMTEFLNIVKKHKVLCAHNGMYDFGILLSLGVDLRNHNFYDTLLAAKLNDNRLLSYSLDALGKKYLKQQKSSLPMVCDVLNIKDEELNTLKTLKIWEEIKKYWSATGRINYISDNIGKISGLRLDDDYKKVLQKVYSLMMQNMDKTWELNKDAVKKYCAQDVEVLRELQQVLDKTVPQSQVLYWGEIERICIGYRQHGCAFNIQKGIQLSKEADGALEALYKKIYANLPEEYLYILKNEMPKKATCTKIKTNMYLNLTYLNMVPEKDRQDLIFNPGSGQNLQWLLLALKIPPFDDLYFTHQNSWKKFIKESSSFTNFLTDSGQLKVDKETLLLIDHPLIKDIIEYHNIYKIKTDFIDRVLEAQFEYLNIPKTSALPPVGRIYYTVTPMGASATGRFSSNCFNIQQIPKRSADTDTDIVKKLKKSIRTLFIPDPGETWYSLDFSSQEVRMYAHYGVIYRAKHAEMIQQEFHKNIKLDFHQIVADMCKLEGKEGRNKAKTINLGLAYGMGRAKLASSLKVSIEEATKLYELYCSRMPFIPDLSKKIEEELESKSYITTLGGRKLFKENDYYDEEKQKIINFNYKAFNKKIQGSSADQTAKAMYLADKAGIKILFPVHDELDASLKSEEEAIQLKHIMENTHKFHVPFLTEITKGKSWGECE